MKRKILSIVTVILMIFTMTSCIGKLSPISVKNIVENEITHKVVEYDKLSVKDLEDAVETVVESVEQAVIGVSLKEISEIMIGFNKIESENIVGIGSGVIYKREEILDNNIITNYRYYVITNRHVIEGENNSEYKIYAYLGYDDVEVEATLLGYDQKIDIACFTFEYHKYIQPVNFANSDNLKKGSFAIAIGNPEGYDFYGSVTYGVISGTNRYVASDTDDDGLDDFYGEYIQHDVSINPGNSGGGLFNLKGELIGINTLKFATTEIDNMGFAIPSNVVKILVEEYLEKGIQIQRPRLGVTVIELRDLSQAAIFQNNLKEIPNIYNGQRVYGVYVTSILKNSTLSNSGIQVDDIILEFGGTKITYMHILSGQLNSLTDYKIGSQVEIKYYSRANSQIKTTVVTLKG